MRTRKWYGRGTYRVVVSVKDKKKGTKDASKEMSAVVRGVLSIIRR